MKVNTKAIAIRAVEAIPDRETIGGMLWKTVDRLSVDHDKTDAEKGDILIGRVLSVWSAVRSVEAAHRRLDRALYEDLS